MTASHRDDDQDRSVPLPTILSSSLDDFLTQVEHELVSRRRQVRALRRRARRLGDRESGLRTRTARFLRTSTRTGLALAGTASFVGGTVLLITGNVDAAQDAYTLSAAAWGASTAVRVTGH
ncbi:hypothetical protein MTQ10_15830 [Streptomyces sp. XM83C]|uniref:Uncharacterized protein n=1 Tax=Streptomyces thermocoprophilus TaxID=78356 RepID=A0ABV5VH57_9ACTN|nr:hypothetical protein [Streptomyces sp. XM83C]MCK1821041.1 hypothetical protein [Streptomyces sp. XM83C]